MNKFIARDGQFWLNDQPMLIQAGEFHYFRTPQNEWRQRLELLKGAGFNAVAAYIPWLWHQVEEGVSDFDGHSHPMRNLAGFLDLAAEMDLLVISRPGPYINAETINEGIPPWVFKNYPQVTYISQHDQPTNMVSYLHPDFLACVKNWYKAVFGVLAPRQISRNGKIILVQLDNEMGMISWVRNHLDTNPDTMTRFAAYLVKTYGDHLPLRYPTANLPEFLQDGIRHPQQQFSANIVTDYRLFYRQYLREYTDFLWSEAKLNGLEVPPVINIHGFTNGGRTFPIGISQLVEVMRMDGMISATDVYPAVIGEGTYHQLLLVNEMTKALHNPQQPLFSIEFQAGGNQDYSSGQSSMNDLHSRLCISTGMRAINHYLFCDGENHPVLSPVKRHDWGHPVRKDGTLRRHYFRYPMLSRVLKTYGSDLTLARPKTITTVGFLLDYFMTEVHNEFTHEQTQIFTHQREVVLFDLLARGLALTHRPFDAVELDSGKLDARQTPLCWVQLEKQCKPATQQKLVDYLHQGGKLVLAGRMCVEDFNHQPCTILKDAIGIQHITDQPPFIENLISAFQYVDIPASFVETYTGDFNEIYARRENGDVVGFIKTVGKGLVMVFGAAYAANTLDDVDVVNQMALKMGCPPLFKMSTWADVHLSCGEKGNFLFISNYQDDPVETIIELEGKSLFGGNPVSLPARRGLILPVAWQVKPGVILDYATAEITQVVDDGSTIVLKTEPAEFFAELTLAGYHCNQASSIEQMAEKRRITLQGKEGVIILCKDA
jgi:beta-galactosidase